MSKQILRTKCLEWLQNVRDLTDTVKAITADRNVTEREAGIREQNCLDFLLEEW